MNDTIEQLKQRAETAEALCAELRDKAAAVMRFANYSGLSDDLFEQLQKAKADWQAALAKTPADMGGCPHSCADGAELAERTDLLNGANAEIRVLRARVSELELALAAIGDLAVADWDDATVGKIDAVVKEPTRYRQRLGALFAAEARNARLVTVGGMMRRFCEEHGIADSVLRLWDAAVADNQPQNSPTTPGDDAIVEG